MFKKNIAIFIIIIFFIVNLNSANNNNVPINNLNEDGKINKWFIVGPFPNKEIDVPAEDDGAFRSGYHTDFLKVLGGEPAAIITKNTTIRYRGLDNDEKIGETFYVNSEDGIIDFEKIFTPVDFKVAYAFCKIYSSKKQNIHFYFGSDDCPKIWINGELVHKLWNGGRGCKPRDDYFKVQLDKGLNPVLVKVEEGCGEWKFILEAFTEDAHTKIMSAEIKTWEQYWKQTAKISPKGFYPMWLSKKLAFWTVVGVDNDDKECLICEEGTIEPYKRGFSITPVFYINDKIITRNDVVISQSIIENYIPIPTVKWEHKDFTFKLTALAYGNPGESNTYCRYTIKNKTDINLKGKFYLLIRPFQVYPPWQGGGGLSKIYNIDISEKQITINNDYNIQLISIPDNTGVKTNNNRKMNVLEGDIIENIKNGILSTEQNGYDTNGYASCGVEYDFNLDPSKDSGKSPSKNSEMTSQSTDKKNIFVILPLHDKGISDKSINIEFDSIYKKTISYWKEKSNKIEIDIPDKDMINTFKANINYILIINDGNSFQPGSWCYDKSFIRDGSIISVALLNVGFKDIIKDYINWYSKYQFESGEIPCVVDAKKEDPFWEKISEYDSQGEYMYLLENYYYYTRDKELLKDKLPNIMKCLKFLFKLRKKRMTTLYRENPDKQILYGIIPKTYSEHHFYWDSFWALKAWKTGIEIAKILENDDMLEWTTEEYNILKENVYKSIDRVIKKNNIDYIPESADKANYYPVSTSGAIVYCDELGNLPQPELDNTYTKYSRELTYRMRKNANYRFTPYEIRNSQAYLYMGNKKEALRMIQFILDNRRPAEWYQFTEVVNSEKRLPTLFGDMPHTWIGAEYINAVRSLFVYEKNNKLILGAGIDEKWFDTKKTISVKQLPTYFGKITYNITKGGDTLKVEISGNAKPESGFILKSPFIDKIISSVKINNKKWTDFNKTEITFKKLPVDIDVIFK